MKATIDETGMLHVVPESPLEEYALAKWGQDNYVTFTDPARIEAGYFRGSNMLVGSAQRIEG